MGAKTPGANQPGLDQPGRNSPGERQPDESFDAQEVESSTGVAVDSTGTTTLGTTDNIEGHVLLITVNPTAADFSFNVNVDGTPVFKSAQSPSNTDEATYQVAPDVDAAFFRGSGAQIVFEVTSASATGGATADVDADVRSEDAR